MQAAGGDARQQFAAFGDVLDDFELAVARGGAQHGFAAHLRARAFDFKREMQNAKPLSFDCGRDADFASRRFARCGHEFESEFECMPGTRFVVAGRVPCNPESNRVASGNGSDPFHAERLLASPPRKIHKHDPARGVTGIGADASRADPARRAFRLTAGAGRMLHWPGKSRRDCLEFRDARRPTRLPLPGGGDRQSQNNLDAQAAGRTSMSGHSKWATIKHKKAATDAKRGRIFTKLIREITIAARVGGGDADSNPRLRTAILAAKNENMPNDNIERALQRGTGQLEGEQYEEVNFEGYGPGGVGMIVQVVTSNRNRIVSDLRHMMSKHGGNMAETGSVGWMFHRKGTVTVPKEQANEDKMLGIVLDAGAEDLRDDGTEWEVVTPPEGFEAVREALTKAGITPSAAEIAMVPQNYIKLAGSQAGQMLRLIETLEEHDDVQHVFANFDIDEKEMQAVMAAEG